MSKLDTFTVIIVGLCLAALGYLVYKTIQLRQLKNASPTSSISIEESPEGSSSNTLTLGDEDKAVDPATVEDGDLDDEQLSVDNGTLVEEEEGEAVEEEAPADDLAQREEPEAPEKEVPASFDTDPTTAGDFLVLAGSFKQKANAEAQVRRLKKMGFDDARVASFNGGSLAVALVGRFDDYDQATELANQVEAKGIDAFVKGKK